MTGIWRLLDLGNGKTLVRRDGHVSVWVEPGFNDLCRFFSVLEESEHVDVARRILARDYVESDLDAIFSAIGPLPSIPKPETPEPLLPWPGIQDFRTAVVGEGLAASKIAEHFRIPFWQPMANVARQSDRAWPPLDQTDHANRLSQKALLRHFAALDLVIVCIEGGCYGDLYDIQRLVQQAGCAALFVEATASGYAIGPFTDSNAGPCLFCAHAVQYARLKKAPGELLDLLGPMRLTQPDYPNRVVGAIQLALQQIAVYGGDAFRNIRWQRYQHAGVRTVPKLSECPLCRDKNPKASPIVGGELDTSNPHVKKVGILGGGTAGYLTALALRRYRPDLNVTLVESSDVPVIGVGEATTPLMPQFLHADLGLDIDSLFREVEPTIKLGIRFLWGNQSHFDYPFGVIDPVNAMIHDGHLAHISKTAVFMEHQTLPVQRDKDGKTQWFGAHHAAYHLDNRRFVNYLKRAASRAGVIRVDAKIEDVVRGNGSLKTLVSNDDRRLAFDFFVDCSGFRSLLLEQTLGSPFIDWKESLPNNRAVVAAIPRVGGILPYTSAEAMHAGWCWNTPQQDMDHRGYVFCSDYIGDEEAEQEMRGANPGMGDARLIRFRTGRHQDVWRSNVIAMGNAYGFVEPLESTALHMLIRQIVWLLQVFPLRKHEPAKASRMNRRVGQAWDYLRWFLAIHFRFNQQWNNPYWRDARARAEASDYEELLNIFRRSGPLSWVFRNKPWYLSDPLWGAQGIDTILFGQNHPSGEWESPTSKQVWKKKKMADQAYAQQAFAQIDALKNNRIQQGWVREMGQCFLEQGPAFISESQHERS